MRTTNFPGFTASLPLSTSEIFYKGISQRIKLENNVEPQDLGCIALGGIGAALGGPAFGIILEIICEYAEPNHSQGRGTTSGPKGGGGRSHVYHGFTQACVDVCIERGGDSRSCYLQCGFRGSLSSRY